MDWGSWDVLESVSVQLKQVCRILLSTPTPSMAPHNLRQGSAANLHGNNKQFMWYNCDKNKKYVPLFMLKRSISYSHLTHIATTLLFGFLMQSVANQMTEPRRTCHSQTSRRVYIRWSRHLPFSVCGTPPPAPLHKSWQSQRFCLRRMIPYKLLFLLSGLAAWKAWQ